MDWSLNGGDPNSVYHICAGQKHFENIKFIFSI